MSRAIYHKEFQADDRLRARECSQSPTWRIELELLRPLVRYGRHTSDEESDRVSLYVECAQPDRELDPASSRPRHKSHSQNAACTIRARGLFGRESRLPPAFSEEKIRTKTSANFPA